MILLQIFLWCAAAAFAEELTAGVLRMVQEAKEEEERRGRQ